MNTTILIEKLVELGADKLESHFDALKQEKCAAANHSLGGYYALSQVAQDLFSISTSNFRADCIGVISARQYAMLEAGEVSGHE